jgi:endonuclease YncB( thermonuclease family)
LRILGAYTLAIGITLLVVHTEVVTAKIVAQQKPGQWEARVVGITDGDTITVLTPNKEEVKIRLYGVDAPERKQAYGSKSKEFLASLVFGQTVIISPVGRDLYGRTIAKVFFNGRDVGLTCIEYGYCWWYQDYARKESVYKKAQEKARKQELGLWADIKPIEPWKFRKNKKGSE